MTIQRGTIPCVLTIAGSDSGGGAGIQADLKTFSAFQTFGSTVITCVTAQNTIGVQSIYPIPVDMIRSQFISVLSDMNISAIKIGMLYSVEIVEIICQVLEEHSEKRICVIYDPVMVATSKDELLDTKCRDEFVATVKKRLLRHVTLITPNIPEAESLCGMTISNVNDMKMAAKCLIEQGSRYALIKGGHLPFLTPPPAHVMDVFYDGEAWTILSNTYQMNAGIEFHGTGCTLSAAITAIVAHECPLKFAVQQSVAYVGMAIEQNYRIGNGAAVLNHTKGVEATFISFCTPTFKSSLFSRFKQNNLSDWKTYTHHAFVQQAAKGTLTKHAFICYLMQDYLFLDSISKACIKHEFDSKYSTDVIDLLFKFEMDSFLRLANTFDLTKACLESTIMSKVTNDYIDFVIYHARSGDTLSALMSMAPCIIGYAEAAKQVHQHQAVHGPYNAWIDIYKSETYQSLSQKCCELIDLFCNEEKPNLSVQRYISLQDIFCQAVMLEIQFWNHALCTTFDE